MKEELPQILENGRHRTGQFGSNTGDRFGFFGIKLSGKKIKIMSSGERHEANEWEHVSVSIAGAKMPPSWEIMCKVKALFWDDDECVIQFHPPRHCYVNNHPGCLHLWKPPYEVPTPPSELVGILTL